MSREQERLDRLMGLLASEQGGGGDMRASVMRRLRRTGMPRRGRIALAASACAIATALAWVGVESWIARRGATDLGELGRRGASWIVPEGSGERAVPARHAPRPKRPPTQAVAPWGRT
jgi:hypothetical protein